MLLSNAPRILAKLKGMDTPEQEGELIQQQMAMNNLMLACSACGLSSSNFSVDDMDDDNDEDEGISSSSLEALLRASLVGGRILEDAGRRVPAIIPPGNLATDPQFMTIDTEAFVSMIGNVIPSIEAGGVEEKRALWERFFRCQNSNRWNSLPIRSDGWVPLRFTCHRHIQYDLKKSRGRCIRQIEGEGRESFQSNEDSIMHRRYCPARSKGKVKEATENCSQNWMGMRSA